VSSFFECIKTLDFSSVFRERVAECKNSRGISENSHSIFQNGLSEMPPINFFFMWDFLKIQWQSFCSAKNRRLYQKELVLSSTSHEPLYSSSPSKAHDLRLYPTLTLHLMKRFSNLKCSSHLVSQVEECSPSVVVNGEFMCSELHGTFH